MGRSKTEELASPKGREMTDLLRCPEINYLPEQVIGTCGLNTKACFKETQPDAPCAYFDDWLKECEEENADTD